MQQPNLSDWITSLNAVMHSAGMSQSSASFQIAEMKAAHEAGMTPKQFLDAKFPPHQIPALRAKAASIGVYLFVLMMVLGFIASTLGPTFGLQLPLWSYLVVAGCLWAFIWLAVRYG